MKVVFIGAHGIPANYGGFETFAEEVSVGLVKKGYEIVVIGDANQQKVMDNLLEYKGVELKYSKYMKTKNPLLFYLESLFMAMKEANIIYSCGSGVSYLAFLPRLFGKKFITNVDGMGWTRAKHSSFRKKLGKIMTYFTAKWSEYIVYDSRGMAEVYKKVFNRTRKGAVLEYGAYYNKFLDIDNELTNKVLTKYNLTKNKYHLVVSRLEPENNVETIIQGYALSDKKLSLIIVGNVMDTSYVNKIKRYENDNIRFVGGIYNKDELEIVRVNAYAYLHGHSVGGTNPSLLEAMASKNYTICHDNIFNREVIQENGKFFKNKEDVDQIINFVENDITDKEYSSTKNGVFNRIKDYYNWEKIVQRYDDFFQLIATKKI